MRRLATDRKIAADLSGAADVTRSAVSLPGVFPYDRGQGFRDLDVQAPQFVVDRRRLIFGRQHPPLPIRMARARSLNGLPYQNIHS